MVAPAGDDLRRDRPGLERAGVRALRKVEPLAASSPDQELHDLRRAA